MSDSAYGTCAWAVLVSMLALWGANIQINDPTFVDVFWGIGFAMQAFLCIPVAHYSIHSMILFCILSVWALRLSRHLYRRWCIAGPDRRYTKLLRRLGGNPIFTSFFAVFLMQGLIMWIVGLPIQYAAASRARLSLRKLMGAGIAILGLLTESLADWQLARFKAQGGRGRVMTSGLWRYSRHPNHFGNCMLWWGIYLFTAPRLLSWIIISPILMTVLLLAVSGVPTVEAAMRRRPGYQRYVKATSRFIPWCPCAVREEEGEGEGRGERDGEREGANDEGEGERRGGMRARGQGREQSGRDRNTERFDDDNTGDGESRDRSRGRAGGERKDNERAARGTARDADSRQRRDRDREGSTSEETSETSSLSDADQADQLARRDQPRATTGDREKTESGRREVNAGSGSNERRRETGGSAVQRNADRDEPRDSGSRSRDKERDRDTGERSQPRDRTDRDRSDRGGDRGERSERSERDTRDTVERTSTRDRDREKGEGDAGRRAKRDGERDRDRTGDRAGDRTGDRAGDRDRDNVRERASGDRDRERDRDRESARQPAEASPSDNWHRVDEDEADHNTHASAVTGH